MLILVTDDEEPIRELIKYNLQKEGFDVITAENAMETLKLSRERIPDLLILDLMLPDMSGLDICRVLKNDEVTKSIPIIMVTAKTEDSDIVTGLELGADDYVTKPFSPKVLIARVKSVLRRNSQIQKNTTIDSSKITVHGIFLDSKKHKVSFCEQDLDFSATEFAIFDLLARHPGQVFSRKQIINAIKGDDYPVTDRSVDVQILSLRKKLEKAGCDDIIETLRGVGYRMCEENE